MCVSFASLSFWAALVACCWTAGFAVKPRATRELPAWDGCASDCFLRCSRSFSSPRLQASGRPPVRLGGDALPKIIRSRFVGATMSGLLQGCSILITLFFRPRMMYDIRTISMKYEAKSIFECPTSPRNIFVRRRSLVVRSLLVHL